MGLLDLFRGRRPEPPSVPPVQCDRRGSCTVRVTDMHNRNMCLDELSMIQGYWAECAERLKIRKHEMSRAGVTKTVRARRLAEIEI